MQDVWDYFPKTSRKFGHQVRIGVSTRYAYVSHHLSITERSDFLYVQYHYDSTEVIDTIRVEHSNEYRYEYQKYDEFDTYLTASIVYCVPLRRQWQIDLSTVGNYYLYSKRTNEQNPTDGVDTTSEVSREDNDSYELSVSGAVRYILDSRTSLSANIGYFYNQGGLGKSRTRRVNPWHYIGREQLPPAEYGQFDISTQLTYRLSIPTTLYANLQYYRNYRDSDDQNIVSSNDMSGYSLSVSLSHNIF